MRDVGYAVLGCLLSFLLIFLWHRHRVINSSDGEILGDTLIYNSVEPDSITAPSAIDSLPLYHFSDSVDGRWSADVVGRDVELRSLVLRDSYRVKPPSWEVALRGEVSPYGSWVGVGVERNVGRLRLSLGGGYDPFRSTPYVEAGVGVVLWRE